MAYREFNNSEDEQWDTNIEKGESGKVTERSYFTDAEGRPRMRVSERSFVADAQTRNAPAPRFSWALFTCIGIGIPLLFVALAGYFIYQDAQRQTTWHNADATITRSEVVDYHGDYSPEIEYTYTIDGKAYRGDLGYRESSSIMSIVERTVNKYPLGSTVVVKVNPTNPSESMLPGAANTFWYIFGGIGAVIALVFLGVGILGIRRWRAALRTPPSRPGYTVH